MTEEQKRKQWFVVHVLSGQEQKVRDNLVKRMKTEEMGDFIYEKDRIHKEVFSWLSHRKHVAL